MSDYELFLQEKLISHIDVGFDVDHINDALFDFQKVLVKWAVKRGRAALFCDTGLGKTAMQVTWADIVSRHNDMPVLILAPLAVAHQTVREAKKFGINAEYHRHQPENMKGVIVANYEMMEQFNFNDFAGIVLDESSILKSYTSKTRELIIELSKKVPYRLSCTATPSPNDFMELGNQAEFMGVMSREEMLAMFFVHDGGETAKWRLKGHGEQKFWRWLATWAAVVRKPSDIGFDDSGYDLPPLVIHEHILDNDNEPEGSLFHEAALGLTAQRKAKRNSMQSRINAVSELVNSSDDTWLIWCQLNDESAGLSKQTDNSVAVCGSDSIVFKEDSMSGFSDGSISRLISKTKICGFGMNWQHCNNMAFAGIDNSFESYYQAIRRCWRFGQTKQVNVHLFLSESERSILENLKRKEEQHNLMSARMVDHMQEFMKMEIFGAKQEKTEYKSIKGELPKWMY